MDEPLPYRPIANLVNISKILEKRYLSRHNEHLSIANGNIDNLQSGYVKKRSCEAALTRVKKDIHRILE